MQITKKRTGILIIILVIIGFIISLHDNIMIILPVNENSEKIEQLIAGFWDRNFNRTIV